MSTPTAEPRSKRRPLPAGVRATLWAVGICLTAAAFGPVWFLAPILAAPIILGPRAVKKHNLTLVDEGREARDLHREAEAITKGVLK